jgi:two-component system alkaline phosphatase synthesis response regulator PhoP
MFRLSIIAKGNEKASGLHAGLLREGFACSLSNNGSNPVDEVRRHRPELVLLAVDNPSQATTSWQLVRQIKQTSHLPIIVLLSREMLPKLDFESGIDDFVTEPWDTAEVAVRVRRILQLAEERSGAEFIDCGDLLINLTKCEVSLAGKVLTLTFKEYELLRFLATNPGKVFNREVLLNRVWGYEYYGGDRTVDVHIRRLRSKIEDGTHNFIETVRNIGYRFREDL